MLVRRIFLALFLWVPCSLFAQERIEVCFNFGCYAKETAVFSEARLLSLEKTFRTVKTPEEERELIGLAIGQLHRWAGEQTPIHADLGGNFLDSDRYGKMDCIDHAQTNTQLLNMMTRRGFLRFHTVLPPAHRRRFLFAEHYSAQIEAKEAGARFAVDSWFFDHGTPAALIPMEDWLLGNDPEGSPQN